MARGARARTQETPALRRGGTLGKYRLVRRIGQGGYGDVWKATDTVEGTSVALKIPFRRSSDKRVLEDFRREARILARLDHPNILRIKNADIIGDRLILVYDLGLETLEERIRKRVQTAWALDVVRQLLDALSAAHEKNIIHRDVKPDNIFLYPGNRVRLADFCIARMADRKITHETTSGTLGFMAPEQAYGHPTLASDVFSAGLVLYRLLSGHLPQWPFQWPYPGHKNLNGKVPPSMIALIRKATAFEPRKRYPDAVGMRSAYQYALAQFRRLQSRKGKRTARRPARPAVLRWEEVRVREFEKRFRKRYGLHYECRKCGHPIGEAMEYCPWCGTPDNSFRETTGFAGYCPECERGVRPEWRYCPWCYKGRFDDAIDRPHRDSRYTERCPNPACWDRRLMPFMRYCPWCKTKIRRAPKRQEGERACPHCRWPVPEGFWEVCAWCGKDVS